MRYLLGLFLCSFILPIMTTHAQSDTPTSACGNSMLITYGFNEREITLNGETRNLLFYIPESYDNTLAVPLILSLHGFASSPNQQSSYSDWHDLAEAEGFIVAYPQGTGFPLRWNSGDLGVRLGNVADDVGYINALMDWFITNWCIDETRIYVNGLSNGGGMTDRLACELSERIAAVGMVAGAYNPLEDGCDSTRPMPVIAFHGTSDSIVPYDGLSNRLFDFPSVESWAQTWAERDGCQPEADSLTVTDDVTQTRYSDCENGVEVTLYTIEDGNHVWYGADLGFSFGKVNAIDATTTIWAFYQRFSLMNDQ
ncbi:MAG: PHB depolymerase family esterase [Aggregatilineales bacterium]